MELLKPAGLLSWVQYIVVTFTFWRATIGEDQCSNLQHGSSTQKCSQMYMDTCNVVTMVENMDNLNRGIQMKTQNQLKDINKKVDNILLKLDPCSSNPCMHGKCLKSEDDFTCTCESGYTGKTCEDKVTAKDCYDLRQQVNETRNGVYPVMLWRSGRYIEVYCDMATDGGGWTVFQMRYNGEVDFFRAFEEYEHGFGDVNGEFWLGLQHIQELGSHGRTELRIDLTAADGGHWSETYSNFNLSPTTEYYLNLSKGFASSDRSNFRMMLYNGYPFTTRDRDFDLETIVDDVASDVSDDETNCGIVNHSGWWHGYCRDNHFVNLNGKYCEPGDISRINDGYGGFWYKDFKGLECLKTSKMMIRRV